MLSFSVSRARASATHLASAGEVVVCLLGAGQSAVAEAFADPSAPRFTAAQGWRTAPLTLEGAAAVFRARPVRVVPAGEAWVIIAEVTAVDLGARSAPLLHHDGGFHALVGPGAEQAA